MPTSVRVGMIGLGLSGAFLLGLGMYGVLGDAGSTGVRELAGLLGILQYLALSRLREPNQRARMVAMGLAHVQALGGVYAIFQRELLGVLVIALAALVVLPLSTRTAEAYYGVATS